MDLGFEHQWLPIFKMIKRYYVPPNERTQKHPESCLTD